MNIDPFGAPTPSALFAHQVFFWNAFPIHPHREGNCLSNRNPSIKELKAQGKILKRLSKILGYPRVVAICRKAEGLLKLCDLILTYVCHPSHGGGPDFDKGMRQVLREEGLLKGSVQGRFSYFVTLAFVEKLKKLFT